MARDERKREQAFASLESARELMRSERPGRAALAYGRAADLLLIYLKPVDATDLTSAHYTLGAVGREAALLAELGDTARWALWYARMALAGSHLADPTGGHPERIAEVLADPEPTVRWDPTDEGRLSPERRIAGAAEARVLLARLTTKYLDDAENDRRWPLETGHRMGFLRLRRRLRRAILPEYLGLSIEDEARRLSADGEMAYAALCRSGAYYATPLKKARETMSYVEESLY
jgi:hypothetical protein